MAREQIQAMNFSVATGASGKAFAVYFDVGTETGPLLPSGEQKVLLLNRADAEGLLKQLQTALFPERPQGLN